MSLKEYALNGRTYLFEDGQVPAGAVEVNRKVLEKPNVPEKPVQASKPRPANKRAKPKANKAE